MAHSRLTHLWIALHGLQQTNPIKTVSLLSYGFLGQESTQLVNGDVWGRALNGVRSFIIARRDFGTWGNRAMSHEVDKWLSADETALLGYSSAAVFDDRLLVTTGPAQHQGHGVGHSGLVALDFHPLTSIAETEQPTWDGMWNSEVMGSILQIYQVNVRGVDYCFVAALSSSDKITLWKLTLDSGPDTEQLGTETRVSRIIESPLYDFSPSGSARFESKLLSAFECWVSEVRQDVDFYLYYRPDQYPCWIFWKHSAGKCTKNKRCAADSIDHCLLGLNLKPGYWTRMGAGKPIDAVIPWTKTPSRVGGGFQTGSRQSTKLI